MREHVLKSAVTIIRAYIMYKPMTLFSAAAVIFAAALVPFLRYLISCSRTNSDAGGHLQSLLAGSVLMIAAFMASP